MVYVRGRVALLNTDQFYECLIRVLTNLLRFHWRDARGNSVRERGKRQKSLR